MNENDILSLLYKTVSDRKENPQEGSYTCYLFEKGLDKILKKVGEECSEVIIASKNDDNSEVVYEISDLLYHLTVLMVEKGIAIEDIYAELSKRSNVTGNLKQFHVVDKNS
ncbi:MAG: phosphoribosyl-ATP diphosphatase [Clostridia bacterium]|nr:phosphoribosyl-ATP diphosphatase [Clostridia bacterium]